MASTQDPPDTEDSAGFYFELGETVWYQPDAQNRGRWRRVVIVARRRTRVTGRLGIHDFETYALAGGAGERTQFQLRKLDALLDERGAVTPRHAEHLRTLVEHARRTGAPEQDSE
jgi:hypothetical protein